MKTLLLVLHIQQASLNYIKPEYDTKNLVIWVIEACKNCTKQGLLGCDSVSKLVLCETCILGKQHWLSFKFVV